MHYTIRNLADRPVLVRLNSGQNLNLSGRSESAEVLESDVRDNARLDRLVHRGIVKVVSPESAQAKDSGEESSRKSDGGVFKKKTTK